MLTLETLKPTIEANVRLAIEEDVSTGDITAELIPESQQATAQIISRDQAVIAGRAWVDEVFKQVDPRVEVEWMVADGDCVPPNTLLFTLQGSARSLLTGERAALNFLQTLSGTATIAKQYSNKVANTSVKLLDTRQTYQDCA